MKIEKTKRGRDSEAMSTKHEPAAATKKLHRPHKWASYIAGLLGIGLFVYGLYAFAIIDLIIGLILMVLAVALDRRRWLCERCGNAVEKTSRMCPTCRVELR